MIRLHIPADVHGQRLDALVATLLPQCGMRTVRRVWNDLHVRVNGKMQKAGYNVRQGGLLELVAPGISASVIPAPADLPPVAIFWQDSQLALICKPAGLHSAYVAHSQAPCLEQQLPQLRNVLSCAEGYPRLLNRLDCGTSGLTALALNSEGAAWWHTAEDSRQIQKYYLALACPVQNEVPAHLVIRNRLNTDHRQRSLVEAENHVDPARHSTVDMLGVCNLDDTAYAALGTAHGENIAPPSLVLLGCRILKGARHQIRAHLAYAGLPLFGDPLYGTDSTSASASSSFFLHCAGMELRGRHLCPPPWLNALPPDLQARALLWLQENTLTRT